MSRIRDPIRRGARLAALALAAASVLPATAEAQSRVRFNGQVLSGRGGYGQGVLTVEQLAACVHVAMQVNQSAREIEDGRTRIAEARAQIRSTAQSLALNRRRLARDDWEGKMTYDYLEARNQARTREVEAEAAALAETMRAQQTQAAQFNSYCSQRSYYDADMRAVRSRLGTP